MKKLLTLLTLLILFSCKEKGSIKHINFYHWSNNTVIEDENLSDLNSLGVEKLYYRFFDVRDTPHSIIRNASKNNFNKEIVPVVYILNSAFKDNNDFKIKEYTANVQRLIFSIQKYISNQPINEIQFDCDWTATTRDNYFKFLSYFKKLNPTITISSTIRLHQLKDPNMGVPPVTKGTLMIYNTGDVKDFNVENSILGKDVVKNYIPHLKDYTIPLDIALPIYSWGVVKTPYSQYKLTQGIKIEDLPYNKVEKIGPNVFKIIENFNIGDAYFYKNYILKVEEINMEILQNVATQIQPYLNKKDAEVTFFEIDYLNKSGISILNLQTIKKTLNNEK